MRRLTIISISLLIIVLAACSASPAVTPTNVPTAITITAQSVAQSATVAADVPGWFNIAFTDARTGTPLKLSDFAGKTVMVEAMAAWCSNCLAQQNQVLEARKAFSDVNNSVVFISLDVDPSENAPQLVKYTGDHSFGWTFALAGKDFANALITQFGRTITNPPSTPIFLISPTGKVSELLTGGHNAADLVARIKQQSGV